MGQPFGLPIALTIVIANYEGLCIAKAHTHGIEAFSNGAS